MIQFKYLTPDEQLQGGENIHRIAKFMFQMYRTRALRLVLRRMVQQMSGRTGHLIAPNIIEELATQY